jgi:hypothetical protein
MSALRPIETTSSPWFIPTRSIWPESLVGQADPYEAGAAVGEPAPIAPSAERTLTGPVDRPLTTDEPVTAPSIVQLHDNRERVKARFRLLRRLRANHDNEGAAAPSRESIDRAIAFVDQMRTFPPFFATVGDDGSAIVEFEDRDRGFFADITFCDNDRVECYRREAGRPSEYFEGNLNSSGALEFLESQIGVVL